MTKAEILSLFQAYGPVEDVVLNKDSKSGENKGSGFVIFEEEQTASLVASLNLTEIGGLRMIVLACTKDPSGLSNKCSSKLTDSSMESQNISKFSADLTNPQLLDHSTSNIRINQATSTFRSYRLHH